jgi:hypothetical protein
MNGGPVENPQRRAVEHNRRPVDIDAAFEFVIDVLSLEPVYMVR